MHREIRRLIDSQGPWAQPVGDYAQKVIASAFARTGPAKDILNGTWLGHPLHPVLTDVPVGAFTTAVLLDVAGERRAADLAVATGVAGMVASAVSGAADAVDTFGDEQLHATVHATVMVSSLAAYLASLWLRLTRPAARPLAILLGLVGYAGVAAGAYVGGEVVFRDGNMVDRHAWRSAGTAWKPLDVSDVPEGRLTKAAAGKETLVLLRTGDTIHAIHATCAHAGGPLDRGTLEDGCVTCPWHGSQFRLADGHVVGGPAVYDQPAYEVRRTEAGGLEARLISG